MRCLNCNGMFKEINGSLKIDDRIIGTFNVHDVNYRKCDTCSKLRYSAETAKKIEDTKNQIIEKFIGNMPISEFIGATAAAKILNISRQAMHKHRQIRRGFIYSIRRDRSILYNINSVIAFKENGDGRFRLSKQSVKKEIKYIIVHQSELKMPVWKNPMSPLFEKNKALTYSTLQTKKHSSYKKMEK